MGICARTALLRVAQKAKYSIDRRGTNDPGGTILVVRHGPESHEYARSLGFEPTQYVESTDFAVHTSTTIGPSKPSKSDRGPALRAPVSPRCRTARSPPQQVGRMSVNGSSLQVVYERQRGESRDPLVRSQFNLDLFSERIRTCCGDSAPTECGPPYARLRGAQSLARVGLAIDSILCVLPHSGLLRP